MPRAQFRNVGVPQLRVNAAARALGANQVQRGLGAFTDIISDVEDRAVREQETASNLALSNLRALAQRNLGGQNAAETVGLQGENLAGNLDEFLANNAAITQSIGQRQLNDFRTNLEKNLVAQRDQSETRTLTLDARKRENLALQRQEEEFQRGERRREANLANIEIGRQFALARRGAQDRLRNLKEGETLSQEDLDLLDGTTGINNLSLQLQANADASNIESVLGFHEAGIRRTVLSGAEVNAIERAKKLDERNWQLQLKNYEFNNALDRLDYEKLLEQGPQYGPGDHLKAEADYIKAVTLKNKGEPPSDDVMEEYRELYDGYMSQTEIVTRQDGSQVKIPKYHAQDVVRALASQTEAKDNVLGIEHDEEIHIERLDKSLQLAKGSRLQNARSQQASRIISNVPSDESDESEVTLTPEEQAEAEVVSTPAPTAVLPTVPPAISDVDGASNIEADTTAANIKALQTSAKAISNTTPAEIRSIDVGALTVAELPEVKANLQESLDSLKAINIKQRGRQRAAAKTAQEVLKNALKGKLEQIDDKLQPFEDDLRIKALKARFADG